MPNRENKCKCGGMKDKRARQCTKCRIKGWVLSREITKTNRYSKCTCGAKKDKRAKQCIKCKNKNAIGSSGLSKYEFYGRNVCTCGQHKSKRSRLCIVCERERVKCERIILPNGHRRCTTCGHEGPITDFWRETNRIDRRRAQCKKCCRKHSRDGNITRRCKQMGLSDKDTQIILSLETTNCEICGRNTGKSFHIDHNHVTGKFRGLLCANCNSGIGLLNDDSNRLRAAAKYLESVTGKLRKFHRCFR